MRKIEILAVVDYFIPGFKAGGPIKTLVNLIEHLESRSFHFKVITRDRDLGDMTPYEEVSKDHWNYFKNYTIYYSSSGAISFLRFISVLFAVNSTIFYLNSFFSFKFSILPLFVGLLRRRSVIIAPRGEFSLEALKFSRIKKACYLWLFKRLNLSKRVVFQASTPKEEHDIRVQFGERANIFICPNIASNKFPSISGYVPDKYFKMVFLGRVSRMKNLEYALNCLKYVKSEVVFDIFGPIEDNDYWERCCSIIKDLPLNVLVSYKGFIKPSEVSNVLSRYNLFFLPTLGENYGHVIVEALSSGLPVLISDRTPWRGLENMGIGWDVTLSCPEKFVEIIENVANEPRNRLFERRKFVLDWAVMRFSGDEVRKKSAEMFEFALKNGKEDYDI
ncbi:glycosyltransferase [Pseudidiomarina sp. WS423]|uniref:glycosyltransferase n=1 Tax=Pseudidiomarina sp. WS423 TaxID=3425124 RepID=UPI003D6E8491